ncbi:torsin-4A-like [Rhinoraja longicauda]
MEAERRLRPWGAASRLRLIRRPRRGSRPSKVASPLQRPGKKKSAGGKRRSRGAKGWEVPDAVVMCALYLLCGVVAVQVYQDEEVEQNLLAYDIDHLEKTLHQELVGQTLAVNRLTRLLRGYLVTNTPHSKPLVLSINGPTGVGKTYMGWLIAKHFRSSLGPQLVQQRSLKDLSRGGLNSLVSDALSRAQRSHRAPVVLLDQVEQASPEVLDLLGTLLASPGPAGTVYIFLSSIGREVISHSASHPSAQGQTSRARRVSGELARLAARRHPVWRAADFIPLFPLDRPHVVQCARLLMERWGFYPRDPRAEGMAYGLRYYKAGRRLYSQQGCKPVPPMVRRLKGGSNRPSNEVAVKTMEVAVTSCDAPRSHRRSGEQ